MARNSAAAAPQKLFLLLSDKTLEEVPDGHVIAERIACFGPAHLPLHGVTVAAGGLWHFDPEQAEESPLFRVLDDEEVKARTTDGVLPSSVIAEEDPVTGLATEDYENAQAPLRQLAAQQDDDGNPIPGTVATEE